MRLWFVLLNYMQRHTVKQKKAQTSDPELTPQRVDKRVMLLHDNARPRTWLNPLDEVSLITPLTALALH